MCKRRTVNDVNDAPEHRFLSKRCRVNAATVLLQHRPKAGTLVDTVNIIWWIVPFVMDVWHQQALANKHTI